MELHDTTIELDVSVEYTFDRGEPMVAYYPDGTGHPGCPPSVEIEGVWLDNDGQRLDIAAFLPDALIESLAEEILHEICQLG